MAHHQLRAAGARCRQGWHSARLFGFVKRGGVIWLRDLPAPPSLLPLLLLAFALLLAGAGNTVAPPPGRCRPLTTTWMTTG